MNTHFYLPVFKIFDSKNEKFYLHISSCTFETCDEAKERLEKLVRFWESYPYYKVIASEVQTLSVSL